MKNKARWKRIPYSIIEQHQELKDKMLAYIRSGDRRWPYLCDNVIKWKRV